MFFRTRSLLLTPLFELEGTRLYLRPPSLSDYQQWAQLRYENRNFLQPWEPEWLQDELSFSTFQARIKYYHREMTTNSSYPFFIYARQDSQLLGSIILSNIRRGVAQTAALGYWIGAAHTQQGFMTEAAQKTLDFAFNTLHLHRLEAACLPYNHASIALLKRLGFHYEGFSPRFLKIFGEWRDHVRFSKLAEEPRG